MKLKPLQALVLHLMSVVNSQNEKSCADLKKVKVFSSKKMKILLNYYHVPVWKRSF